MFGIHFGDGVVEQENSKTVLGEGGSGKGEESGRDGQRAQRDKSTRWRMTRLERQRRSKTRTWTRMKDGYASAGR